MTANDLPVPSAGDAEMSAQASRRALVECGLWMRLGFVGASAAAAGVAQLVDASRSLLGIALLLGGAAVAAMAWRRAKLVLDRADARAAPATPGPAARFTPAPRLAID